MILFIKKRILSFIPAFKGLFWLFKNEANAQVHIIATIVVISAGYYFKIETKDWLILCFAIGLVITAEALNTAIEKVADFIHPEFHERIGFIKDIAAGAVFFAAMTAIAIGLMIYLPKFT